MEITTFHPHMFIRYGRGKLSNVIPFFFKSFRIFTFLHHLFTQRDARWPRGWFEFGRAVGQGQVWTKYNFCCIQFRSVYQFGIRVMQIQSSFKDFCFRVWNVFTECEFIIEMKTYINGRSFSCCKVKSLLIIIPKSKFEISKRQVERACRLTEQLISYFSPKVLARSIKCCHCAHVARLFLSFALPL